MIAFGFSTFSTTCFGFSLGSYDRTGAGVSIISASFDRESLFEPNDGKNAAPRAITAATAATSMAPFEIWNPVLKFPPHLLQNFDSSGTSAPHLEQNIINSYQRAVVRKRPEHALALSDACLFNSLLSRDK